MAEAVGAALGLPLTGSGARSRGTRRPRGGMEQARATDRERAAAFLERSSARPACRRAGWARCGTRLERLHAERHLWSRHRGRYPRRARPACAGAGLRLGVVSNSDGRVEEALARRRPARLLRRRSWIPPWPGWRSPIPLSSGPRSTPSGVRPEDAVYVGDLYDVDVAGARAAGHAGRPARAGRRGPPPGLRHRRLARGAGRRPAQGETRLMTAAP